jgi:H+/gluconate symporter-like permease
MGQERARLKILSAFRLVKASFRMSMGESTRTITVRQSIVAAVGLGTMNAVMPPHEP